MPGKRCYTTDNRIRFLSKRWTSLFPEAKRGANVLRLFCSGKGTFFVGGEKMKKIVSLILALVMIFALAACGQSADPAPVATEAPAAVEEPAA